MHRILTVLATTATTAALTLAAVPSAQAGATADSWDIPDGATITIDGHGYGHGRGMSQYGAERAAAVGAGYRDIVDYYYPGTTWGRAAGSVRVWISDDLTNDVQVAARKGLVARKVGSSRAWRLTTAQPRADRWRIVPDGDRRSVLEYRRHGWHRYRSVAGSLELSAGGKPVRLYVATGTREYRGVLRSVPSSPGNRITVNVLPMEAYLRGVVPEETFASTWHPAALRAQAVASRTYAAHQRVARRAKVFDVCDNESCQVYGGATAEHAASDRAVRATAREVLTYAGSPALTEFTASSGGWTVAGDRPYLPAMADKWDHRSDPNHAWSVDFDDQELEDAWPAVGELTHIDIAGRDGHGEWGGRAGTVTLTGDSGTVTVSGDAFYQALHLRSAWLSLTVH